VARGDPESFLRWTTKSTRKLAAELKRQGYRIGDRKVAGLLHQMGYSLQANAKTLEGKQHPDRNAQFEYVNAQVKQFLEQGLPLISVDTKEKELVGNFSNRGQEWQPQGEPQKTLVQIFLTRN
jgi:elongation factor P hydroxylase